MDQAAVWLAGSILFALGSVVIVAGVVVINNILHKYWKPVKLVNWINPPAQRFASEEELARIAPHLDQTRQHK